MIELSGGLLQLLSQEIKRRKFFAPRLIDEKIDIITSRGCRPKSKDTACSQQTFGGDFIQDLLRVIKKLARLFSNCGIVENCRISSAQFPHVKKRRPIDILAKIDNRRRNLACFGDLRF